MDTQTYKATARSLPTLSAPNEWERVLEGGHSAELEALLPEYIKQQRWFGAKARQITSAQISDTVALTGAVHPAVFLFVRLAYKDGGDDTYALPLTCRADAEAATLMRDRPHAAVAQVASAHGNGVVFDALFDPAFCALLLDLIAQQRTVAGAHGALVGQTTAAFGRLRGDAASPLTPKIGTAEQSNTSIIYGGRLIMKLFRKVEAGINPDLEIGRFLTERSAFDHVPPAAGTIEYRRATGEPAALAFLQGFVANQGDAWSYTLDAIVGSFKSVLVDDRHLADAAVPASLLDLADREPPEEARTFIGGYLTAAALLGQRTADLHRALAADTSDADFAPEPFDEPFRSVVSASIRGRAERAFGLLRDKINTLPEPARADGERILAAQDQISERLRSIFENPLTVTRTRIHGDYHLGQILATGDDFFIIDFEGEPARPLAERRVKSSPLQDVAGMLRSFHYAPYAALLGQGGTSFADNEVRILEPWARYWHRWASATFLRSYLATVGATSFIPQQRQELQVLLDLYLLDKALYELAYELNNRPTWVRIPLEGVLQLLD